VAGSICENPGNLWMASHACDLALLLSYYYPPISLRAAKIVNLEKEVATDETQMKHGL
jgi:hypothetical protein